VKGRKYEFVGEAWEAEEGNQALWHVEATVRRSGPVNAEEEEGS
jgi:hypothetical protein